ncbi:hypothetical protein Gasu2_68440 [Galdieria sulphuraria]|uniref:Uncharacterized protein n=1 Tax=Galdieria sulphuraria TaxID=130081 RepID=M2XHR7_GALSU|nr:uncharacterized protein Gasu_30680 [Galdieria sulphuraria]EME29632.1 hypothetical protein Gasu_30680 [Galdieria sulphuraria]GJD12772.1 hypothetical protein Gasu2_68440 [Galdieria sulphuraria]|eukprot:XP_005706152.1 hypothetical protein Gasu_30680 [Galdieria sulphuraria]
MNQDNQSSSSESDRVDNRDCPCLQGGVCSCEGSCACRIVQSKFQPWKDTAKRIRDVVIFPLISGLMLGLGTVVGRRLGEAWFYPRETYATK